MEDGRGTVSVAQAPRKRAEDIAWDFYLSTEEAWAAMYEACQAARVSIDCEQYILNLDWLGERFLDLFERKAAEGLRVRVLCDMVGSITLYGSDRPEALRSSGVDIHFFNPIDLRHLRNIMHWPRRNHRKLLIVDSSTAFTGGVCLEARMRKWRDTHVRVDGPVVGRIEETFTRVWSQAIRGRAKRVSNANPEPGQLFQYVSDVKKIHHSDIYRHIIRQIRASRRYVYLTTPYFIPDHRFLRALSHACRRGVDVRLLVPGRSDNLLVDLVARSYYGRALKIGVRIYFYEASMIHAKSVVVDDEWATVGSCNLDYLSFFSNYEANLMSREQTFAAQLRTYFRDDLTWAREIKLPEWRNRSVVEKVLGYMGRLVKKFL